MKNEKIYLYIAAFLSILVPTPGRFVYGVTLMTELLILMVGGIGISILMDHLKLKELKTITILFTMIVITLIFRQIFVLLYPELIMTLGFIIFIVPVSTFMLGFIFQQEDVPLNIYIKKKSIRAIGSVIIGLLFFLLRDIAGYGTFTFFGRNHQIVEKIIFAKDKLGLFTFVATIPGSLFLCSLAIFIHLTIKTKFEILNKAGV